MDRDEFAMSQAAAWEQERAPLGPLADMPPVLSAQRVEKTYRNGTRA
jgi:NitT/TauT family transport system ATP-binding protein